MVPTVSEVRVVSAKIPEDVYNEMILRIPEGDRSNFIREALMEKLQKTPKADKVLGLEKRMVKLENELAEVKKCLADLELLTYKNGEVNAHAFCIDEIDHKIVDYLLHYKGATTPELADYIKTNRWMVLNRLRKIQRNSKKQYGKPILDYYGGEKSGKKKAWWINEDLVQE
jgi:hypothetical protein